MPVSWTLQVFDELSSTQDMCKTQACDGASEGLCIQALSQTDGRGRQGRAWEMGAGNLALSFILRPKCSAQEIGQISILIGVAIAQSIGEQAQLKWPNDVLIDGEKCAGILIESDLKGADVNWLCVGVGVNTQNAPDIGAALTVDRDEFRDGFLARVSALYDEWQSDGFAGIRQAWLSYAHPKGTTLNVGVFEDLDEAGNLVVRTPENTLQTYSSGDVYLT